MIFRRRSRKFSKLAEKWNFKTMFGPHMKFESAEAYKLLRTNIMFSFSEEGHGHVIGITSAIQGEGKSSTACNAAYALAEAGGKVLLLDADLRRPSIATKLGLAGAPGLTNMLVSRWDYKELIQHCPAAPKLDIITSGDIPPNPSELLGAARMEQVIQTLMQDYDYIIMDLPPVTVVSDALAVSKLLHGVILVVRGSVSDRKMLAEALRQLKLVDARVLGFVYRENEISKKNYGGKYYNKYYTKYYSKYKYGYYPDHAKSGNEQAAKK